MPLIEFSDRGLFCPAGNFYIDPWQPVERAVITHGHSDHARWGSRHYLCHEYSLPVLRLRLGENSYETTTWGSPMQVNGVSLTFYPAGHIIGSSQVKVEHKGEIWVVSGDYKTENDGISGAFEPVKCHTFITESTFGLPIYRWHSQEEIYRNIRSWVNHNRQLSRSSVLIAYSLGKAQRVLKALKPVAEEVFAHGAVYNMQQHLLEAGVLSQDIFPKVTRITPDMPKETFRNGIIIAPPSAESSSWIRRFTPYSLGICSGWMQVRGNQRRKNADAGFALSDHSDWNGLLSAVEATGATKVFVTHGFQSTFSRYLNESGIEAAEVKTEYGNDEEETTVELTNDTAEQIATDE